MDGLRVSNQGGDCVKSQFFRKCSLIKSMACKARMLQKRGFSHSLGVQLTPAFGGGIYSVFKKVLNLHEEAVSQKLRAMCDQYGAVVYAKIRIADILPIENSGISNEEYAF